MREAGSPWKVSVAVDPKLIGATNVRLIALTRSPASRRQPPHDSEADGDSPRRCWHSRGAVNVASLGKLSPGWGQTEDFIAPWFATLEAKNK